MKSSEDLKNKIHNKIDALDEGSLEEFYGIMTNFINSKKDMDDWEILSREQKQGIIEAIDEIKAGKGIPHEKVMSNIHRKYFNA